MTSEQIEAVARAIAKADMAAWFPEPSTTNGMFRKLARAAIAAMPDRKAAMIEGARLALEAAANDAATWFPANTQATFKAGGVVGSIRALDPAQIVGGNTAIERGEHLERGE